MLTAGPTCSPPGSPGLTRTAPTSRLETEHLHGWFSTKQQGNQEVTPRPRPTQDKSQAGVGTFHVSPPRLPLGLAPGPTVVTCAASLAFLLPHASVQHACNRPPHARPHPVPALPLRQGRAGSTPLPSGPLTLPLIVRNSEDTALRSGKLSKEGNGVSAN